MGWTSSYRSPAVSIKDYLSAEINGIGNMSVFEVIDIAIVKRNTAYLAVKKTNIETGESIVYAMVILIRYGKGKFNITTKEMDETMGPLYYECPKRILDLLTPTDKANALEWRDKCRAVLAQRESLKKVLNTVKEGSVFKFGKAVEFTKGGKYDQMTFHHRDGRKHVFMVGAFAMYASFEKLLDMKTRYGLEVAVQ